MLLNSVHNYTHFQGVILNREIWLNSFGLSGKVLLRKVNLEVLFRQTCANVTCQLLSSLKKAKIMYRTGNSQISPPEAGVSSL